MNYQLDFNQQGKTITATTTSPYFTASFIDSKCAECATTNDPQLMTVSCDICKTLTVKTTEITTLGWWSFAWLVVAAFMPIIVIGFFRKRRH